MLLLLGINNLWKLDPRIGMDLSHHSLYLANIVEQFRIPLPSEGLFAFRSPLFYMIAAGPFALFQILFNEDVAAKLIRIVPILMSVAQVEIV